MSDRRQEFRVGIVALATIVIVVLLVSLNTGASLQFGGAPYEVLIRVDRAPGVAANTPVQKDGVLIGRVVSTEFIPGGGVMVRAKIRPGAPIYKSDTCRIQPSSLFGDAVINFAYAGAGSDTSPLEPGSEINGAALPDPLEALTSLQVEIGPAIKSIGDAADGFAVLTERISIALGEDFGTDKVHSLLDEGMAALGKFSQTMDQMSHTLSSIDDVFGDPEVRRSIKQAATEVPLLLSDARSTVQRAEQTLDSFSSVVVSAQNNLENLEELTKPLGEKGPELAHEITSAVANLNLALADVSRFAASLNSSDGTLSRLVNDATLYNDLSTVVANANTVLMRINTAVKDLKPVLYDARVFMDKIAREPGRLVGGAMNKGPGLK